VGTEECCEVFGPYHQSPDGLEGHHTRGTYVQLQGTSFTHQMTWASFRDDTFPADVIHADLGPSVKDHYDVVGLVTFVHELCSSSERPPGRH